MKHFKVVAYKTQRYEMEVEAENKAAALETADGLNGISPMWVEDFEYYHFEVAGAEEVVKEDEEE
jgi:hypothetical protein